MRYLVLLNGRTHEVDIEGARVTVGGIEHRAVLSGVETVLERLLLLDGRPYSMALWSRGRGVWTVLSDAELFDVEAVDERTAHIRSLAGATASQTGPLTLKAPMPGLVVRVLATQGEKVVEGSSLIVLEAMKMENELKASAAGIIERISATPGRTVEKGEVLITFRSS